MTNTLKYTAWLGTAVAITSYLACTIEPVNYCCETDAACDDGSFCNGTETCDGCFCVAGPPPCGDAASPCVSCDEQADQCIVPQCIADADCDDDLFCNGAEICDECSCRAGTPPCGDPPPPCTSCDEQADQCMVPECIADADCDDDLFCNGTESCIECSCLAGTPPCENDCNEDTDTCFKACVDDSDCQDGSLCTHSWCWDGACRHLSPRCDCDPPGGPCRLDAECNTATGLCELPDGSDPCLAYCALGVRGCIEPDISKMDGFDTSREVRRASAEWCMTQEDWCFSVAGTCADGTLFLIGNEGDYRAEYFDPETGDYLAWTYASDAIENTCCGITYWPMLIECEDAVVTEVFAGLLFQVGDSITLPGPRPGPCL